MTARVLDAVPAAGAYLVPERPLLAVRDLDVHYGLVRALHGVTLEVREGEMVALVGANGAGKSTTLRAISGLVRPSRGAIELQSRPIGGLPAQRIVRLGVAHVPEGRELFPSLTVLENLQLGHWVRGEAADFRRRRDQVMDYFPKLRERARQAAGTLSGGEQQMLVIARGLMSAPRLLIVDELSLGLAPMIVEQLFEILHEVNRDGTAVLLVEQFVHMALQHTDRAYVLAKGAVAISGSSSDLLTRPELLEAYLGRS